MNYVEVPVNIQWGPDLLIARPFVFASPFIGYNLKNRFSKETTLAETITENSSKSRANADGMSV